MRPDIANLGQAVRRRRAELRLTQAEVTQAGGPSDTTQTSIETGTAASVQKGTLTKLDTGLQWEPGSAAAVLAGGDPKPLSDSMPSPRAESGLNVAGGFAYAVATHPLRPQSLFELILAVGRLESGISALDAGSLTQAEFRDIAAGAVDAGTAVIRDFFGGTGQMDEVADILKFLARDTSTSTSSNAADADSDTRSS